MWQRGVFGSKPPPDCRNLDEAVTEGLNICCITQEPCKLSKIGTKKSGEEVWWYGAAVGSKWLVQIGTLNRHGVHSSNHFSLEWAEMNSLSYTMKMSLNLNPGSARAARAKWGTIRWTWKQKLNPSEAVSWEECNFNMTKNNRNLCRRFGHFYCRFTNVFAEGGYFQ